MIMPEYKTHAPGTFCYAELVTPDPAASGDFYMTLFGWSRNDQDLGEFGIYTQYELDGKVVAAQFKMPPEQEGAGVPPNWGQYVSVADVDDACARAGDLGGQVVMGPMDVFEHGRMAVLADPQGAVFCLWQPKENIGVDLKGDPGSMCWNELLTNDTGSAGAFYGGLFGWEPRAQDMGDLGTYTIMMRGGGDMAAGMIAIQPDMGPIPPHWLVYFAVPDCDAGRNEAEGLGARVLVPPTDIPETGRFSVIQDPVGAVFAIFTPLST